MALSTLSQRLNGAPRAARRQVAVSRSRSGKLAVMCKAHKVTVLPGDGIGPEITKVAIEVLEKAGKAEGETFEFKYALIGGAAIDATGNPLPAETLDQCKASDAVLLAAIGG
jgi:3-isopropylmalate dehydrogenase